MSYNDAKSAEEARAIYVPGKDILIDIESIGLPAVYAVAMSMEIQHNKWGISAYDSIQ